MFVEEEDIPKETMEVILTCVDGIKQEDANEPVE